MPFIDFFSNPYVDSLNISSIGANDVLTHQQVRDIAAATIKDSIALSDCVMRRR
jgi:hypothetical protein